MAPIGTTSFRHREGECSGCQRYELQAIVSSVGPYRFSRVDRSADRCQSSASCRIRASPQNRLQRSDGREPGRNAPRRRATEIALGTENQTVIFLRSMNSARATNACTGVLSSVAPAPQAMNMSNMARSKVAANVWEQTSAGVNPYRCWLNRRNWSTFPWLTGTPLGRPVEPDV